MVNFADLWRNNTVFMWKKNAPLRKIIGEEKSQILSLTIFNISYFLVSAYALCDGGESKILFHPGTFWNISRHWAADYIDQCLWVKYVAISINI